MPRSRSSKSTWLREHQSDPYVRRAQAEGYRSRAVYKLMEMDQRDGLIQNGMTVLDIGAAPGSWAQWVQQRIGRSGRLVAVDLLPIEPIENVQFLHGDIRDARLLEALDELLDGRHTDLVISDIAPNISGMALVDQARGAELLRTVLNVCERVLRREGALLVKLFEGEQAAALRRDCEMRFQRCVIRKPKASRARSRESYLLARGYQHRAGGP
ncbi:MAG: RlmE family RNA methyltransferase [Gammaproteobacteria bacterium]|nr:RlmE family RNA methyltransferase [Gammaproteobacteria bacterium]MDH3465366.1 RlmE family RNA methyltransferase [Gammaproteobacteria bacterium]